MNPIIFILGFVVLLGVLIYYVKSGDETSCTAPSPKDESVGEEFKEEADTLESETVEGNVEDVINISGIGPKFKELLSSIGYDSVKRLREASPEDLYAKLISANEDKEITKRPPTLNEVEQWVNEAKSR